ncbi:hypothetical protein BKX95_11555 [Streptococcus iniae]|nr:hypothetical protein BKX95_11555 [Streptococcus iniae]
MDFKEFEAIRLNLAMTVQDFCKMVDASKTTYTRWKDKGKVPDVKYDLLKEAIAIEKNESIQLEANIDFLRIRFRTCQYQVIINEVLKLKQKPFVSEEYSRYGYTGYDNFNHINVYYATDDDRQGTLVEMSGKGCREFEWYLLNEQNRTWSDFFKNCYEFGFAYSENQSDREDFVRFTRIDIALDEPYREGQNYDLGILEEKKKTGLLSRKSKTYRFIDGESNLKSDGRTIYFGTRQSGVMLSFYEKDYEQASKLKMSVETYRNLYGIKNRYEIRLNKDASNSFVFDHIKNQTDLGVEAIKCLHYQLQVFELKEGRTVLDEAWYSLFGIKNATHFKMKPQYFPVGEKEYQWYERSVAGVRKRLTILEEITGQSRLKEIDELAEVKEKYRPQLNYLAEEYGVEVVYD